MIVYELVCTQQHRFEGWFASAEDFERQRKCGMLSCPVCADPDIAKLPSARIGGFAQPEPSEQQQAAPSALEFHKQVAQLLESDPASDEGPLLPPDFLDIPPRPGKPRPAGITHVLDPGIGPAVLADVLAAAADLIDIWKIGWGTAYVDRTLLAKAAALAEAGVDLCLGGTLLATTLAHMAARRDNRIKSATYFVTMTDFSEAGELGVFIDEEQLQSLEEKMNERGYLEGREMATTFNMLRANDLIWSFVVNNYLLGQDPFPFDLLYWNDDSTRMPACMHSFYLRRMYQDNDLVKPGAIELLGEKIDLRKITVPSYLISTREDHIAPWKSTYRATQIYSGPVRFVLAASGHIAGIVNPPDSGKYSHWVNENLPPDPEEWFRGATELAGSWWPDWHRWVTSLSKEMVPARVPGAGGLPAIEDAPGSYVKVIATD